MGYITLNQENIQTQHICCAFSDKKCAEGYQLKKLWLQGEMDKGYVFHRLDERAKVFIEYGPTEQAWIPVTAPNTLMLGCFWVSGRYKHKGHGKALLQSAVEAAEKQNKHGLVTVTGAKKFHFMSDTRWLLNQGFEVCDTTPAGFQLLYLPLNQPGNKLPCFNSCVKDQCLESNSGCVVYYSNRCPFTEYHVQQSLVESCRNRNIPLTVIKLESRDQAQSAPTPATIFSLFWNGRFVTTDIGACMDSRFDKLIQPE